MSCAGNRYILDLDACLKTDIYSSERQIHIENQQTHISELEGDLKDLQQKIDAMQDRITNLPGDHTQEWMRQILEWKYTYNTILKELKAKRKELFNLQYYQQRVNGR